MGVNSLPKTVTRQRRGCDLNPGPSAPESSTLTLGYQATLALYKSVYCYYYYSVTRASVCQAACHKSTIVIETDTPN